MSPKEYTYIIGQQDAVQEVFVLQDEHTTLAEDEDFHDVAEDLAPLCTYLDEEGEPRRHRPMLHEPNFWRNLVYERTGLNVPTNPFDPCRSETGAFSIGVTENLYPTSSHIDHGDDEHTDKYCGSDDDIRSESDTEHEGHDVDNRFDAGECDTESSKVSHSSDGLSDPFHEYLPVGLDEDYGHQSDSPADEVDLNSIEAQEGENSTNSQRPECWDWTYASDPGYDADDEFDQSNDDDDDDDDDDDESVSSLLGDLDPPRADDVKLWPRFHLHIQPLVNSRCSLVK
ncbi:hypothetical protein H2198_002636 [Neophaeococcomyces mojaviensis]|uniref:Uncharacterized protein n=1 Tax=Neophaeococcomyces mojaviensis TaxID=3383035 RepID=A0ACC3ADP5_9EURO|nr:hypothetical protein H2198_002636 [Knufia sp. JES_112]